MATGYRYQTPRSQQYQSTFVPLPLDYLNQAMLSRQQAYDQNYQNMMAAEDKYASLESTPGAYTTEKQRILDEAFGNIQKTVQDKYGGDYSQGTNEIMQGIVGLRKSPFWNYMSQDLTDYKQKKAVEDQLRVTGNLGYSNLNEQHDIGNSQDGYKFPKREVYSRSDVLQKASKAFAGLYTKSVDDTVKSDLTGYIKMVKTIGASPEEIDKAVTLEQAKQILDESPDIKANYPELVKNPELFRQQVVNELKAAISQKTDSSYMPDRVWDQQQRMNEIYAKQKIEDEKSKSQNFLRELNVVQETNPVKWNEEEKFKDFYKNPDSALINKYDTKVSEISKDYNLDISSLKELQNLEKSIQKENQNLVSTNTSVFNLYGNNPKNTPEYFKKQTELVKKLADIEKIKNKLGEFYDKNRPDGIPRYLINPGLAIETADMTKISNNQRELNELITKDLAGTFRIIGISPEESRKKLSAIDPSKIVDYTYNSIIDPNDPNQQRQLVTPTIAIRDKEGVREDIQLISLPEAQNQTQLIINKQNQLGQVFRDKTNAINVQTQKNSFEKWDKAGKKNLTKEQYIVEEFNRLIESVPEEKKEQAKAYYTENLDDDYFTNGYYLYQNWLNSRNKK